MQLCLVVSATIRSSDYGFTAVQASLTRNLTVGRARPECPD
jgi:hypothetical protein